MKNKIIIVLILAIAISIGLPYYQRAEASILGDVWDAITQGFSSIFAPALQLLANLLPSTDPINMPFKDAITQVLVVGYQFSFVFPWSTLFLCLWVMAGIEIAIVVMKFVMWIIRLARG